MNSDSLFLLPQHMHSTGPVRTPDPDGLSSVLVDADHSLASLCSPPFAHPTHIFRCDVLPSVSALAMSFASK